LNKLIFKTIDEIEISYVEKLKFLQLNKHEQRLDALIAYLTDKTENMKSVIGIEDKIRQELQKSQSKRRLPIIAETGFGRDVNTKKELSDRITSKKLPANVRS
jgi:ATP-dependent Lon protease